MRRHVDAAHEETGPMLEETTTLLSQREEVETEKKLLDAFNKHFTIADEDLDYLISNSTPVDNRFFTTLGRLKQIHGDCRLLLGYEDQKLGLDLMENSSKNLNTAFQKLYRWIQKEFKTLNLENPQINATIRRSLRVLAERPALFQSCLEFFADARERDLSNSFYAALTGSSNAPSEDSTTKPIEYYAHEPLRFVGNMLAWTHSATVSEREALEVLFVSEGEEMAKAIQAGIESEPWLNAETAVFDGKKALEQLVNRDLAGVARALRQRVQQIIQADDDAILAYKVANLIDFYRVTFARLLGSESSVLETLSALRESALSQYRSVTRDNVASTLATSVELPPDLGIPEFLEEALTQIRELMKTYDSSLSPMESREDDFRDVLRHSLDPYLEFCKQISGKVEEPQKSIFTVNCLMAVKATLVPYEFTKERVAELDDTVDEHAVNLVDHQHAFFLHTSGLHPLLVALATLSDSEEDLRSIAGLDPFQPRALTDSSQTLDDFLPSALMDAMDNLKLLKESRMAETITEEAANRYCEDFEFVEAKLAAADELLKDQVGEDEEDDEVEGGKGRGPVKLRTLFPRTSGEIKVLLS